MMKFLLKKLKIAFILIAVFRFFEKKAIETLSIYDENTRNYVNAALLLHEIPTFKESYLELAIQCQCNDFIAHPSVQFVASEIWNYNFHTKAEGNVVSIAYIYR